MYDAHRENGKELTASPDNLFMDKTTLTVHHCKLAQSHSKLTHNL